MASTHQQVSGEPTVVNEQTHNEWQSTLNEVEEQVQQLSNLEQIVDTMRVAMELASANFASTTL